MAFDPSLHTNTGFTLSWQKHARMHQNPPFETWWNSTFWGGGNTPSPHFIPLVAFAFGAWILAPPGPPPGPRLSWIRLLLTELAVAYLMGGSVNDVSKISRRLIVPKLCKRCGYFKDMGIWMQWYRLILQVKNWVVDFIARWRHWFYKLVYLKSRKSV